MITRLSARRPDARAEGCHSRRLGRRRGALHRLPLSSFGGRAALPVLLPIALALVAASLPVVAVASQGDLVTVTNDFESFPVVLRRVSPQTAETLDDSVVLTLPACDAPACLLEGVAGIATHPTTGVLYGAIVRADQTYRELGIIDPDTGIITPIGDTGLWLTGLTFDDVGTLYGVTDEFGNPAESIYTLDLATGAASFVMTQADGGTGDSIAFNTNNGLLYKASGHNGECLGQDPFNEICFRAIDLEQQPPAVFAINAFAPLTDEQISGLVYWEDEDRLLWKQGHDSEGPWPLFKVRANGISETVGNLDHNAKDLAFLLPEPGSPMLQVGALLALLVLRRSWRRSGRAPSS